MQESVIQGTLGAGTTTIYTCPVGKTSRVNLSFTNTAAYGIKLSRYDDLLSNTVVLYSFNLSAGDTLVDDTYYLLKENDQLIVDTTVAGNDYTVYYLEQP